MKNKYSFTACILILATLLTFRLYNAEIGSGKPLKITDWDAFGYYMYLPATFIYHDIKKYDWLADIDQKYAVTGGPFYQVQAADNGNLVGKYLGGVAIMQAPFFFIGHAIATHSDYPPDGFSKPYQYALAFGALLYAFLAILLLRTVLLRYFGDGTTAITLLLVCLATNYIEYGAVETGQSHCYIFLLYSVVLFTTIKWHETPKYRWAFVTGLVIGLATMSRPTEAIMLFIPLLWATNNKEAAKAKWALVGAHKWQVLAIAFGGLLGVLPQLLYWKMVTGSFVYDVGSKWVFLNPFFRVLFGWEKGWFIYTPVTLLLVLGMAFMKRYPFQKAVLTFCLLNIWIIIAWEDWRYGGSYSTRALVQSYPVFAFAAASLIERIEQLKWKPVFYLAAGYLLVVNIFQTVQYNKGILHYNDMNRLYYSHIYLNPKPTPIDMSLLDGNELPARGLRSHEKSIAFFHSPINVQFPSGSHELTKIGIPDAAGWLKIEAMIIAPGSLWQSELHASVTDAAAVKDHKVRLFQPIGEQTNRYAFYLKLPPGNNARMLSIFLTSSYPFKGKLMSLHIFSLGR